MTPEEYKSKIEAIKLKADIEENTVAKEYALSNNPVKVGDIIKDHIGTLKVKAIKWCKGYTYDLPTCVYSGVELKADGITPCKKQTGRYVYQSNLKKII